MTINSLRDALPAVPFKPFTFHLPDGRSVPVPHPDFITVPGAGRTAIVASDTEDRFTIIDLSLVTRIEAGANASTSH